MSTQIIVTPGISIVTFNNVPSDLENNFIYEVFDKAAIAGINIDMICQSPATSDKISFGFTFPDDDMMKLLSIMNLISSKAELMPMVNVGNVKLTIKSADMVTGTGFASRVFGVLKELDCLPLLVSTGIDEISLLVYESTVADLEKKLREVFAA
ncbi:MAG: aspartate kinase [Oscillospiraceae bacterium]|nr:aspartate kinase [Oscillospiraceae bacterium]